MKRTADSIEEQNALKDAESQPETETPENTRPNKQKLHPAMIAAQWKPGQSGNVGGRPKNDIAKEIAQAIFENNKEAIYAAMSKPLLSGNAYAFKELAERGFGKLKEVSEVTHIHGDVKDSELNERIAQLERDLGLARTIDDAGRTGIAQARAGETVEKP